MGDFDHQVADLFDFVRTVLGGEVDVSSWAPKGVGSQENAAFQDEVVGVGRDSQSGQEAFKRIETQILGTGPTVLLGESTKRQECVAIDGGVGWEAGRGRSQSYQDLEG